MMEITAAIIKIVIGIGSAVVLGLLLNWWKQRDRFRKYDMGYHLKERIGRTTEQLGVIREKLQADRADVYVFENGSRTVAGVPCKYISLEVSTYAAGLLPPDLKELTKIPVVAFAEPLKVLLEEKFVYLNSADASDIITIKLLSKYGIKQVSVQLFHINKIAAGFITVGWLDDIPLDKKLIKKVLEESKKKISIYMSI